MEAGFGIPLCGEIDLGFSVHIQICWFGIGLEIIYYYFGSIKKG